MNDPEGDWDADPQLSETPAKRELGFVTGGPIPDSFFDPLPDDELERWDSA